MSPAAPFRRRDRPPGVTDWQLRTPAFRRLLHDVYVDAAVPRTAQLMARAALLVAPEAVLSHHSAARLWGAIAPDDGVVHVACPGRRPQVEGVAAHRLAQDGRTTTWRGLPVTTPVQTFLDLAPVLGLVDLVVLGDSLVRRGRVRPEALAEAAAAHRGSGARLARRAARLVRADVDSAMESRLRLLIVLAGLPEPVVNHTVRWADGRVRWRFDLSFPEFRLVIEYDGQQHRDSDTQWDHDVDRREWLDRHDHRLVVIRSKDLYRTPALTLTRITAAMRDRGMPVPHLSDRWRQHFPGTPDDLAAPA